ncbi:PREDICTED: organic cation transporter protein-like [Priapulus caudatus]|uniref:Organic cation transporter protein-like n=1 Tax=Priapulus caudatus TaxID=37621 RepID=A0ABM1EFC2_PRICU|nr:PREDICTED: organic cation transporter protein-like [Priapulus caudatus]
MHPDQAMEHLGAYGRFQMCVLALGCLITFACAWQFLGITFLAQDPEHHCRLPAGVTELNGTIPYEDGKWAQCSIYDPASTKTPPANISCPNGWKYSGEFQKTVTAEWDLVCGNAFMKDTASAVFMAGVLVGALTLPTIADMIGRKRVISVGLAAMFVFSATIVFVKSFVAFIVMRFFTALLLSGSYLSLYVLCLEWFPPAQRAFAGVVFWVPWVGGYCVLPVIAYFVHDWRHLQLIFTIPIAVVFCYPWLLPESVHWLVSQNKRDTAMELVQKAAKTNGSTLPDKFNLNAPEKSSEEGKKTLWHVLHTPLLRVYAVMMCFLWFVNSLVYYGLSFGVASWGGNIYVNFFLAGLIEAPSYVVLIISMKWWGRQKPTCVFHLIAGIPLLILPFLPQKTGPCFDLPGERPITPPVGSTSYFAHGSNIIGKFGISTSFGAIYLFASELYPTVVRNAGLGISSVFARIGGIIAPYLANSIGILEPKAPPLIFAALSILAAVVSVIIPETSQLPLMESLEDSRFLSKSYRDARLLIAQEPRETSLETKPTNNKVRPIDVEPVFTLHNSMQEKEDPKPIVTYHTSL